MAAPVLQEKQQSLGEWLPEFFRHELALYPGRVSLVGGMVIAATLSMIVVITFRIPYGAVGVTCAFVLSRENLAATAKSGIYYIAAFAVWVVLMPIGVRMLAADPMMHFFGVVVAIFVSFYALKALAYFPLAVGIVVVATGTLTIWYLPGPTEENVELTLWQILATAAGALITLLVEVVFHSFAATTSVTDSMGERLKGVEDMLRTISDGNPFAPGVMSLITQYAMTGTSTLRRDIARTPLGALERDRANALIGLLGYGMDISAAIVSEGSHLEPVSKERVEGLAFRIQHIRQALGSADPHIEPQSASPMADRLLLFSQLEAVVSLMEHVLAGGSNRCFGLEYPEDPAGADRLLVRDAFSNPEYLKFALTGTAAAMLCYVIYIAVDWPGISTAVTTCALTALSNIGSSRQKQLLRIGGSAIGGFVFGIGSQIFVLPYLDSIAGFTILFACVTAMSAYVATSSPRLAYAGLQMAFAFYLIAVSGFSVPLDLTIGRDRAVGVLLGIGAMWLAFERLYPQPAASQMVTQFARSARLVASLNSLDPSGLDTKRLSAVRDRISGLFTNVNAEADAVLFESGPQRTAYLAARVRIRRWLASLRTLYLLQLPFLQFDKRGRIPDGSQQAVTNLLAAVSHSLNHLSAFLESQLVSGPVETAQPESLPDSAHPPGLPGALELIWLLAQELERDVFRSPIFALDQPDRGNL
jgi:multidrug resistance protein MdtO